MQSSTEACLFLLLHLELLQGTKKKREPQGGNVGLAQCEPEFTANVFSWQGVRLIGEFPRPFSAEHGPFPATSFLRLLVPSLSFLFLHPCVVQILEFGVFFDLHGF